MRKTLSLKKTQSQSSNQSQKQKSITHFFTKNNCQSTNKETTISQDAQTSRLTTKRKANSPVQVDTHKLINVPNKVTVKYEQTGEQVFKKIKANSPCKITCKSPQKQNNNENKGVNQAKSILKTYTTDTENKRLPLSPKKLENDNCTKNKVTNHINGNHEMVTENIFTPKKQIIVSEDFGVNGKRSSKTPERSPLEAFCKSPHIRKLLTPEKFSHIEVSPSKSGSTIKSLEFCEQDVGDMFGEEWDVGEMEDTQEDLDLTIIQRCEVLSVKRHVNRLDIRLKNSNNNKGTCFVEGIWLDTPLSPGEIVSVLACRNSSNQFYVGNTSGLLVLRPDHLISSTSVVSGVFCKRKAILQEQWKGIDCANTAMTVGILIHELVQKALTQQIMDEKQLSYEADLIIKESLQRLYDAGITEEEARSNIQIYITPLSEFMINYVGVSPPTVVRQQPQKDKWNGHIDKILDIEENLCCPQLGLKGKIDATLQVTIHDRKGREKAIVPLELKSGKASVSAEHRGQVVLYGMMLSLQRDEDPTTSLQRGLLLYLKERVELREVSCGYPERRDLIMLRNQLVQHLSTTLTDGDTEQIGDIEEASSLLQQKLPDPIHHENACSKCPYLTLCSLHLWHCDGPTVSETHPLSKLRDIALGHLSLDHIKYFKQWTALLRIEEGAQHSTAPLHSLWTDSPEKRSKRGSCAPNLTLKSVVGSEDRYLHIFQRSEEHTDRKGPQEGEFSIVSLDNRPWIAAGVVTVANENEMHILLERDVSRRMDKSTKFHIDTYESYATVVNNLTNLGVLMEDSDRALTLRKLIIDKEEPKFDKKLPRDVGRLGTKLMRSLNIQQQRAVLKALAAQNYALLQGLPGTGKTQTISVLIQMLVALKQRVLVTAHTHSAVDNVLSRLPESISVMRLGSAGRVSPSVASRCEQRLAAHCRTTRELEALYGAMEVVGVTCLGAAHAMLSRTTFDVCIVDEATQVLQCTVLRPLFAAKRFVLVGDPEQLPPVVRSRAAKRLGMEESLFHRLMREEATSTLQLQYRMNQALVDFANVVSYKSQLKCADEKIAEARLNIDVQKISCKSEWLSQACSPKPELAAVFVHVPASGARACANQTEGCVVLALAEALIEGGVKSSDIGVIAPYRDQVGLLRRTLSVFSVEASTVDQFQGRDKSVIIYSCTRSDVREDASKVKEGEVLNDQRRLAVSVTRAKHKFIVVGNSKALKRYAPLQRLIQASVQVPLSKETVSEIEGRYRKFVT
ncbi:DNA replication ATP-dependent helicase/nuclease DNA2 [Amyelois transitella]|uniref:DNA replication ATP-dependent helicase/nuclease DNA2 n=1 Tax=Amyelois transitella TaxID=680683 RepID=UPI00299056CD|nr:DNA replication ATP-dependent helicase/nuclease DNA2 [Amyelois transitella]